MEKYSRIYREGLDPVGREDKDIDNDGDHDKSDKYLLNRRRVRKKAIKTRVAKESYSNWREDLSEVMEVIRKDKNDQKISEKKVDNYKSGRIKINPTFKETVETLGGTLIEMIEIDEIDYIVESAYDELINEGYDEDEIEEALEYALTEAKVTFGHDTSPQGTEKKKQGLLGAARQRLSGIKKRAKQAVATGARKVAKGALKVARKMEKTDSTPHPKSKGVRPVRSAQRPPSAAGHKERVSSGSYVAPTTKKKSSQSIPDPWEGSETAPAKSKAKKTPKVASKTTRVSTSRKPKAAAAPAAKAEKKPRKKREPNPKREGAPSLDDLLKSEDYSLNEVAVSKKQQRFMGMVLAVKRGAKPMSPEVAKAASGISGAEAKKFAKTKHKGLPEKVREQALETEKKTSTKPQNAAVVNQVLQAKQKTDNAQKDLAMKQRVAAQKGVNLTSLSS